MGWRAASAFSAAVLAMLVALPALALPPQIRIGEHEGFTRLAIEWPEGIRASWKIAGHRLAIEVDQPLPENLTSYWREVDDHVRAASLAGDQRSMELDLDPHVDPRLRVVEGKILVIDFHARAAAKMLGLRIGKHSDFVRMVLEPITAGSYQATTASGRVRVELPGRLALADLQRIETSLAAVSHARMNGESLELVLAEPIVARTSHVTPDKLVIDIPADRAATRHEEPPTTANVGKRSEVDLRPKNADESRSPEFSGTTDSHPPDTKHADMSVLERDTANLTLRRSEELAKVESLPVLAVPHERGVELRFMWPVPVSAAVFARAGQLWVAFHAKAERVAADRQAMARYAGGYINTIRQEPHADATIFRFALTTEVETRVQRDNSGWGVIIGEQPNARASLSIERTRPEAAILLADATAAVSVVDPIVGDTIGVAFYGYPGGGLPRGREFVDLSFLPTTHGMAWRNKVPDLEMDLVDPGVLLHRSEGLHLGDWLSVGRGGSDGGDPAAESQVEDMPEHNQAEPFEQLEQAQSHGESPPLAGDELKPSIATGTANAAFHAGREVETAPLLDLSGVLVDASEMFLESKRALLAELGGADDTARPWAYVDLARLNLAHGRGMEAGTYAELAGLAAEGTALGESARFSHILLALKGAAGVLADRLGDARKALAASALDDDPEIELWRRVLDFRDGVPPPSDLDPSVLKPVLEGYGNQLRIELALDLVQLYLDNGRGDPAFVLLDNLERLPRSPEQESHFRLVQGTAFARDGDLEQAVRYWQRGAKIARLPIALELATAIAEARVELGEDGIDQAIALLESERPLWRGRSMEDDLLRRLGSTLCGRRACGGSAGGLACGK